MPTSESTWWHFCILKHSKYEHLRILDGMFGTLAMVMRASAPSQRHFWNPGVPLRQRNGIFGTQTLVIRTSASTRWRCLHSDAGNTHVCVNSSTLFALWRKSYSQLHQLCGIFGTLALVIRTSASTRWRCLHSGARNTHICVNSMSFWKPWRL